MQLAKCKWCGRPFQSYGLRLCARCVQELDEQYRPVRDYVYDNPHASIEDVVRDTGVDQRVIMYYLRDGRLEMVNAGDMLRCEHCGATINSGRLCTDCASKVEERISKPMQDRINQRREREAAKEDMSGRMHTRPDRTRDRSH